MLRQVLADQFFGRGHEPEADLVVDGTRCCTEGEARHVEQRIEQAGIGIQLDESCIAPGQVVDLFLGGQLHLRARFGQTRREALTLIERLGTHLAGVIDAHQASGVLTLFVADRFVMDVARRRGTRRLGGMWHQGTQYGVELMDQLIGAAVMTLRRNGIGMRHGKTPARREQ